MRFEVPGEDDAAGAAFLTQGRAVLEIFARQRGFVRGHLGRSADDPARWLLSTEWEGVGAYRRALSAYDVRVEATDFLNRAVEEPTAFEVLERIGPDSGAVRGYSDRG
ncbi:MAG: hypothetical protein QOH80_1536 [Actinomycetota bacterium]|jgi:hypothetical protein|nr:hypothetical protein [Actinomycetota bacterium]